MQSRVWLPADEPYVTALFLLEEIRDKMKRAEKCFVIMPFSQTTHADTVSTTKAQWDHIYDAWITRAIGAYKRVRLNAERSSPIPGNFVRGIVSDLSQAFLVIADLTGNKPNVFYELGIRHALRTGTILITQDIRSVPSDLKSYYAFAYAYTDKAHEYEEAYAKFQKELHEKIDAFIDGKVSSDSPVSDFLGFRKEVHDRQLETEKAQLKRLLLECGKSLEGNFHVAEYLLGAILKGREIPLTKFPMIDIGPIDALYTKLLSFDFEMLSKKSPLEGVRRIVSDQRQAIMLAKHHWDAFFLLPSPDKAQILLPMLQYFVKTQKPAFKKYWPRILAGIDTITVDLVLTEKGKKTVLSRSAKNR